MRSGRLALFSLCALAAALASPFLIAPVANQLALRAFGQQLEKVDVEMPEGVVRADARSRIYVTGNDEACTFKAQRIYDISDLDSAPVEFESRIKRMRFSSAKDRADGQGADLYVRTHGDLTTVAISDGPYAAGFDLRCW